MQRPKVWLMAGGGMAVLLGAAVVSTVKDVSSQPTIVSAHVPPMFGTAVPAPPAGETPLPLPPAADPSAAPADPSTPSPTLGRFHRGGDGGGGGHHH